MLKVGSTDCLVIEDAGSGVEAAHAAEMKVIAIPNQYTRSHNFAKADKSVSSLKDVSLDLIASL